MATRPTAVGRQRAEARRIGGAAAHFLAHLDHVLLVAVAGLIGYGLFIVGQVTENDVPRDPGYYVSRQGVALVLGLAVFVALLWIDPERLRRVGIPLYAGLLLLLGIVLLAGAEVNGARRWIELGFLNLQPSELGKVVLVLLLSAFLAERARQGIGWRTVGTVVALVAVPGVLVFIQPDFGTSLVYGAVVVGALLFAGTSWAKLGWVAAGTAVVAVAILWILPANGVDVLKPYQVDRLVGFLDPSSDPSGTTYNVTQSITAVGSGGLHGRGADQASQTNLDYLPEHQTDFVFSSLAERRGFLGAAVLLLLYAVVIWRGLRVVSIAPSRFTAIVAGSIVVVFLFHVAVNVGMAIGIAPVVGIPLPFVSYGGTALITMLAFVGLLQSIHVRGRLSGIR